VGDANKRLFEKMPAFPKGWRVLGNLVDVSLCEVKVTVSGLWRDDFISNQSRLAAVRRSGGIYGLIFHTVVLAGNVSPGLAVGRITLCMM
jgi:hypothetical protein